MTPSNVIDWSDKTANLYGCQPCPKCKSTYRASYNRDGGVKIECPDCGHIENGVIDDE